MKPSGYRQRPDDRGDLLRRRNRFVARHDGKVLANRDRTFVADEHDHPLVAYVPRDSVALDQRAGMHDHSTHCPDTGDDTGDARYRAPAGTPGTPIAWSYDAPYPRFRRSRDVWRSMPGAWRSRSAAPIRGRAE